MTLWRSFSGSKPKSGEDGIGGGSLGLPSDPVLDLGQSFGGLMDVVPVSDVGECFEQLLETVGAVQERWGHRIAVAGSASCYAHYRRRFFDVSHPRAFLRGIPVLTQSLSIAG